MNPMAMFNAIYQKNEAIKEISRIQKRVDDLQKSLSQFVPIKHTGWFVLLGESPDEPSGYKFVGFFNPDVSEENQEPEWSIAIPIATNDSIKEFMGW